MNIRPFAANHQDNNRVSKYCHELHLKLWVAEKQVAEGAELLDHDQVMARLRGKINAAKEQD
ncbi:hypothetical protein D3C86_2262140 [compost metagenome]